MSEQTTRTTTEYRTFLLRLSRDPAAAAWRITVRGVDGSQPLCFPTLDQLVIWLEQQVETIKEITP